MFAGLLDAGLEEVDGLEEDGGENAGAETGYEVEGCLVERGFKLARSQRSQRLRWGIRTGKHTGLRARFTGTIGHGCATVGWRA